MAWNESEDASVGTAPPMYPPMERMEKTGLTECKLQLAPVHASRTISRMRSAVGNVKLEPGHATTRTP